MNSNQIVKITAAAALFLTLSGCGSSFTPNGAGCSGASCSNSTPNASGNHSSASVTLNGSISGGSFDQVKVISLDQAHGLINISLPLIPFDLGMGSTAMPINGLPGATLGLTPSSDGTSSAVTLSLPITYLVKGASFLPPGTLPNGDPLPSVPSGELPSLAINLGKSKVTLYLAVNTVGIFVNTPFNPYLYTTWPIKDDASKQTLGFFSTVPKKGTFQGGFFLSMQLPNDIAIAIDNML